MEMKDLQDLFYDELKDIYDAEHQLIKTLPKMAEAATSLKLKKAFNDHLAQTEDHVRRLEEVFDIIEKKAVKKRAKR